MTNIEATRDGNILTLKIDLSKNFGKSRSGKSNIIATTEGNVRVPGSDKVKMGINVYEQEA